MYNLKHNIILEIIIAGKFFLAVQNKEKFMNILESLTSEAKELAIKSDWGGESLRINTQILAIDSKDTGAYTRLGVYFFKQEKYLASREMFATSLFLDKQCRISKNKLREVQSILLESEEETGINIDINNYVDDVEDYFEALSLGISLQTQKKTDTAMKFIKRSAVLGKPRSYKN